MFGIVALAALYVFFNSFVTQLWYQSRQNALHGQASRASVLTPKIGQAVGLLQVEQPITMNAAIVEGDGPSQLRAGPGHRPGTPLPGSPGNSVVYGRKDQWGGPFKSLAKLETGSTLFVESRSGKALAYTVIGVYSTAGNNLDRYLGSSDDYRITLVTDGAGRFSDRRLVVVAVSGTVGRYSPAPAGLDPDPSRAGLADSGIVIFADWLLGTAAVVLVLRKRHKLLTIAVAATPTLAAALLAGFVSLDLLWSPLA